MNSSDHYAMSKVWINSYSQEWKKASKQNYICVQCGCQFIDFYDLQGYSEEIKRECLEIYVNSLGFRAIDQQKMCIILL